MTITIDQLIQVLMKEETDDAGMRAVVRAIRDDMNKDMGAWEPKWAQVEVNILFDKILGIAAEEKVAGGSAREDEKAVEAAGDKGPVTVNSPATDHAPAVCVWTRLDPNRVDYRIACAPDPSTIYHPHPQRLASANCANCGKPITFTEANHG